MGFEVSFQEAIFFLIVVVKELNLKKLKQTLGQSLRWRPRAVLAEAGISKDGAKTFHTK